MFFTHQQNNSIVPKQTTLKCIKHKLICFLPKPIFFKVI
ncbi:hypothetical protein RC62_1795 [Flavobacterium aquidurense]|uniref:Uncharacterized protein n=1 Tax=Flavobacterium aquidurense TaxID=362413 RepID=A0A0Q1BDB9_9FLAO|nr:hypothetical protein RC62_1795 [Flavobacterium aquidurense]